MEQSPFKADNGHSAGREITNALWKPNNIPTLTRSHLTDSHSDLHKFSPHPHNLFL
jgi:hypothetical protein